MNRVNLNLQSQNLAEEVLLQRGLADEYFAEVKTCTDMRQVFDVISEKSAEHFAILSPNGEPIRDIFGHIKDQLSLGQEVALALFYKKADQESWVTSF